jgi:hypothetical protein
MQKLALGAEANIFIQALFCRQHGQQKIKLNYDDKNQMAKIKTTPPGSYQ